ncbi:outer membrane lipoprotein-sorting protein [Paraburkholderia adhaesiva]|uniref:outer membrane lipoprotein-sorting protein n=1 Tax=Paraburkholderia adhaesiva TaxID=2883244 RepID=UPI001F2A84D4|nr:outer membrane lipoprotein-sorting protein [Paraburkholderia adhaesiva]
MKRVTGWGSLFVAGLLAGSALTAAAAGMSGAQVADRNAEARGGLQTWRSVNTLTMTGQIDVGGTKPVQLPFTLTMKRPHKSRFELRFNGQTSYQVFDGAQGWKVRPFLGRTEPEPYSPAELHSAASTADLDGPLIDYAAKGNRIDLVGTDSIDGHRALQLKVTLKDHTERHVWVDASTFLETKVEGDPRKLDGKMHTVSVFYRDYRKEGGVMMPHVIETVVAGVKQVHRITIDKVTVNQPVDDSLFAKPLPAATRVAAK